MIKFTEQFLNKWRNKELELAGYNLKYEGILKEQGEVQKDKKKKIEPYYTIYYWKSEEMYNKFKEWAKGEIKKLYPLWKEEKIELEYELLSAMIGLSEKFRFTKENLLL